MHDANDMRMCVHTLSFPLFPRWLVRRPTHNIIIKVKTRKCVEWSGEAGILNSSHFELGLRWCACRIKCVEYSCRLLLLNLLFVCLRLRCLFQFFIQPWTYSTLMTRRYADDVNVKGGGSAACKDRRGWCVDEKLFCALRRTSSTSAENFSLREMANLCFLEFQFKKMSTNLMYVERLKGMTAKSCEKEFLWF